MKLEAKSRLLTAEVDDNNVGNQLLRALKTIDSKPVFKSRRSLSDGVAYTFWCEEGHLKREYIDALGTLDPSASKDSTSVTFTVNTKFGVVYEATFKVLSTDGPDGGGRVVTFSHLH